jgi:hypothetical protein
LGNHRRLLISPEQAFSHHYQPPVPFRVGHILHFKQAAFCDQLFTHLVYRSLVGNTGHRSLEIPLPLLNYLTGVNRLSNFHRNPPTNEFPSLCLRGYGPEIYYSQMRLKSSVTT